MDNKEFMKESSDRRYLQIADPFIMDDLRQMQNAPHYNYWLYNLLKPFIGKRVLEIGSGIGNMTRNIIKKVDLLVGVEPNKYCSELLNDILQDETRFIHIQESIENCNLDLLKKYQFDTIICVNVLEHIADDAATLLFFEEALKPGGKVVLLVPAFPQAYGPIDKAVGHFRRYTKRSLAEIVKKSSLRVERLFYSNLVGLLGWWFNARIKKSVHESDLQIKVFDKIVPVLSFVEGKIVPPIGLSLIAILEKNDQ